MLYHVAEMSGVNAGCAVSCGRTVGCESRLCCITASNCKWYHCYEINRKPKSSLAETVGVSNSAVPLHNVQIVAFSIRQSGSHLIVNRLCLQAETSLPADMSKKCFPGTFLPFKPRTIDRIESQQTIT